jgi:hypothetical protein
MKKTACWLAALLSVGLSASHAHAQIRVQYPPPWPPQPRLPVPDACGPGFYVFCPDGSYLGPNYYLRPPFEPFNGMRPQNCKGPPMQGIPGQYGAGPGGPALPAVPGMGGPPQQKPMVAFPTHPYARSPRDFFMWSEAQEDLHTRERRPAFVP